MFCRVVLPLSKPALVTLAVLAFLTNWNDFLWPVYVLFSPETQTLPAGLHAAVGEQRALRPAHGRRGHRERPGPAPLRLRAAFVIEGVSRSGLKG